MTERVSRPGFWQEVADLPLFVLASGAAALSMYVPAVQGVVTSETTEARAFFYSGTLGLILIMLVGIAMSGRPRRQGPLGPLLSLFSIMLILPLALALPFYEGLRTTTFFNAYLEMVSAITTTGVTVFEDPDRLSGPLHLWRAQVGWMGGFVMWVAAVAILAPLNLGGFEITARAEPGREDVSVGQTRGLHIRSRVLVATQVLLPIYAALTALLWVLLLVSGDPPLVALCHAMSILSTSGISPVGGLEASQAGLTGEAVMFLFMVFAVSRLTFSTDTVTSSGQGLQTDPEFRLAAAIVILVPTLLFLRHFVGASQLDGDETWLQGLTALWGALFTVMSFLTTTGFVSSEWDAAQNWSGLGTPGLVLMGLAMIGGGVATTAGGVKLLRVFALYRQGLREMERLVHPSSISGARGLGRRLQRHGAFIAWVFFMLFALSLAAMALILAALGVGFENAMVLSVAGLTNTGPLITSATETPINLLELSTAAKMTLCAAMVVGRLETLAIIALLTPDLWRG